MPGPYDLRDRFSPHSPARNLMPWRHLDFDLDPFFVIMNGGAVGGLIGLVGAMVIRVRERVARHRAARAELKL